MPKELRLVPLLTAPSLILLVAVVACGVESDAAQEPADATATAASGQAASSSPAGATPSPTPKATAAPTKESSTPTARPPLAQTSPETDREALVALYNATDGPNWGNNDNWLSDEPIGEWKGVSTDGNGRVVRLNLWGNRLSGEISPGLDSLLSHLSNLRRLDLRGNQLSGEIPPELGSFANLT